MGIAAEKEEFQFTPPRGGRQHSLYVFFCFSNFNSRPRAGGDEHAVRAVHSRGYFNSRPRAGGDSPRAVWIALVVISIHAPARGATPFSNLSSSPDRFQFTPPRGGRREATHGKAFAEQFQFTPPRGGRPVRVEGRTDPLAFQFTPPRGGRLVRVVWLPNNMISIHAPARGATNSTDLNDTSSRTISIHAPARGATKFTVVLLAKCVISIHAPARGATANLHKNKLLYICKMLKWRTEFLFSNSLMHKRYK